MTNKQVWLITGAGRGLGLDIARAALAAVHAVIATGRDPEKVAAAIGQHDDLLAVKLDVTNLDDAHAAVTAASANFGRVDVPVNNAGNFYAGFFEELSPEQVRSQGGDPAKLANALVRLAALHEPPARFAAGADALQTFEAKAEVLLSQANAHRVLSASLAFGSA